MAMKPIERIILVAILDRRAECHNHDSRYSFKLHHTKMLTHHFIVSRRKQSKAYSHQHPTQNKTTENDPMAPEAEEEDLVFYPAFCFKAAPTHLTWVKMAGADLQRLRRRRGFEGTYLPVCLPIITILSQSPYIY